MVCVNIGATAGVGGVLQGMQKRPDLERVGPRQYTPQLVVSPGITNRGRYTQLHGPHPVSCADRAGFPTGLGTSHGDAGAERRDRAVEMVGLLRATGRRILRRSGISGLAARTQTAGTLPWHADAPERSDVAKLPSTAIVRRIL